VVVAAAAHLTHRQMDRWTPPSPSPSPSPSPFHCCIVRNMALTAVDQTLPTQQPLRDSARDRREERRANGSEGGSESDDGEEKYPYTGP
jgi:hypothetical protein